MTTNREWLYSLEPSELSAWFDADCSETESINKLTAERDAAYAKNRALKQHIANMQEGRNGWHTKAEKLQAKVTELTAERDELKGQVFTLKGECEDLENELHELTAERDKLQEQLRIGWECECRLQAERERYREKFGKCLDYADAIHALMDEGMA